MSADLSNVLDVGLGLALLFVILSLLVSTIGEFVSRLFAMRANTLFDGITSLLGSSTAKQVYDHQLVLGLSVEGFWDRALLSHVPWLRRFRETRPSYLGSQLFSTVIGDLTKGTTAIVPTDAISATTRKLHHAIAALPDERAREALTALVDDAARRAADSATLLKEYRAGVEAWFNVGMERVTGWHKRNMQLVLFMIGLLLAIGLNADSVNVAATLYREPAARETVMEAATRLVEAERNATQPLPAEIGPALDTVLARLAADSAELDRAGIPLGWGEVARADGPGIWAQRVGGWLITALALSLGAPFWFDVLNRLVNLRSSGAKPAIRAATPPAAGTSVAGGGTAATGGVT